MAGIPAAERHGEEFEVRGPVEPPRFSPIIDDIILPEELTPTPEDVASDISPIADDLPAFSAENGPSVGAKRSQVFPAAFSPIEDDISIPEDHTPTPEEGTADISPLSDDLPGFSAEYGHMAGRKRSRNFSGAASALSPPQIPATANLGVDYLPHVASNDVYIAGEPVDAGASVAADPES
jgi:hypothetical protein